MRQILERLRSPQIAFAAILLFGLLAMTARPATDPDLWWHLRTGQWIVETGHVPHSDPFSFTRAGHAWVSHEWLSEVVFYELWKHGGAAALIVFSAIITTAGFLLLYLRCLLYGVQKHWALLFAYGLGLIMETAAGNTPWQEVRPIVLRVMLLLLACLALVPLNPSGAQLYRYPFDTLRSYGMRSFIVEWFSPDFHDWLYRPFLLLWLLLLTALATSRSRPKGRVIVPLLLTSFAALDAVRHIPIFVLVAIPVIAAALPVARASPEASQRHPDFSRFRPLFNTAVVILIAVFALVKWVSLARSQDTREAEQYPQRAVAFLQASAQTPRLFVYYDWGGYSIWKLYPEYRVFVDGRADLYGDVLLRQFKTVLQLRTGWRDVLDSWKVEAVLVPPSCALAQALLLDPNWHVAFTDSKAIILLRTHPAPVERRASSPVTAWISPVHGGGSLCFPVASVLPVVKNFACAGPESEKMFPRAIPNLRN